VHNEHNPLADCGRYTIGRDAQIRTHVQAVHPGNVEHWALHAGYWKTHISNVLTQTAWYDVSCLDKNSI
jgi:hypothetical protein